MLVDYDLNQADWGSSRIYGDDISFKPRYLVVHWGGGTSQIPAESEDDRLRIWQSYHINSRGWDDIAYNYAVGDSGLVYRLRGYNRGGHVKCSEDLTPEGDSYCDASLGIVWIGGLADADGPSNAALASMAKILSDTGLPIKGHRTVKEENDSYTACPGEDWLNWIENLATGDIMPTEQWHQMIDALFDGRPDEFQGDPNYWKTEVPTDSPEWSDFWAAFVRAIS